MVWPRFLNTAPSGDCFCCSCCLFAKTSNSLDRRLSSSVGRASVLISRSLPSAVVFFWEEVPLFFRRKRCSNFLRFSIFTCLDEFRIRMISKLMRATVTPLLKTVSFLAESFQLGHSRKNNTLSYFVIIVLFNTWKRPFIFLGSREDLSFHRYRLPSLLC